ncbi:MAG: ribulose-phosphate 3-epimerase [Spirochaetales bacterium]|nr:ribulose-phosphate 3-epimerase [Spirochaetales bacterium]
MIDQKVPLCAPSLLSADFTDVASAVRLVEHSGCPWLHLDIMDGHFVPNLTFGPKMIRDIKKITGLFLDAHLMISNPESSLDSYIDAGSDAVTIHYESLIHVHRILSRIKERGVYAGISFVPSTPVETLHEILPLVDLVLVMSVNPGFGGQVFIPGSLEKIRYLADYRREQKLSYRISVDGGVHRGNAADLLRAGVDILVAGSAFFNAPNPAEEVPYLLAEKII